MAGQAGSTPAGFGGTLVSSFGVLEPGHPGQTTLVGMVAHCVWRTHAALSGPPSPDLYANHVSFQLVAFLIVWVPAWLIGLLVALVGDFAIFGRKPAPRSGSTH